MFKNKSKLVFALSLAAFSGIATVSLAKPNIGAGSNSGNGQKLGQLKTTASCRPATAAIDLDINNVRARLMTGGDMWWDNGTSEARYEVPKGSRKNSLFAGSVWIGGYDAQGQLKVAAQTYRQSGNDYWPGPLDEAANIDASTCNEWDRFWKVNREDINRFKELKNHADALNEPAYEAIKQWPATGNINAVGKNLNPLNIGDDKSYAPFVDVDGDKKYRPDLGDYPDIQGDQYIWWVFNDKGNVKGESNTEGIGLEVQASAFAYSTKDFINDATFYNYKLINRGNLTLDSTYIATWTDADLGYHLDDFIGCDVSRGLGILYNATSTDGTGAANHYGEQVPMVGVDFFKGPKKFVGKDSKGLDSFIELKMEAFTYYNNDNSIIGNPRNGTHIYYYMTGSIQNGQRFTDDYAGPGVPSKGYGGTKITSFVFTADPSDKNGWSECNCNNAPNDRRFVHSSGPFKLEPGVVNDITIGAIWVSDVGGCPNTSFRKIRAADDLAQALYNNGFKRVEGPEAPRMVAREMDRKIVFYLVNDPISNNYGEKFGRDLSDPKFRASAITSKPVITPDSLYKFEGYRVFQLKNENVKAAQIFDEKGEVNTELAVEVFQTDIQNGISRIVNYNKRTDLGDSTWEPVVMVNGKDSGIRHSFVITQDQFAKGNDRRLVNYRNYYFVAVAYAHNEFAPFNINDVDSSQDKVYIESSKGGGGSVIPVVIAMPNPANGNMGTVLNADYGDGVKIKRLEGSGNGGNTMEMTEESEAAALASPYVVGNPEYKQGNGPIDVKVIDPVKLQPADWLLFIEGGLQAGDRGLKFDSRWRLVNQSNNETIYGEQEIGNYNEQILEKYGLSIAVQQVLRPGDDQINGNGYITSSIIFQDPGKPWLAGNQDAEGRDRKNWIRSGAAADTFTMCDYNDRLFDSVGQFYEGMMSNNTLTRGTWAPYVLGATGENRQTGEVTTNCGFGVTKQGTFSKNLFDLHSVDVVLTSDKSKWTRCVVVEQQENTDLAEGKAQKFAIRRHASWNLDVDGSGRPVYSTDPSDTGMSYFPGYAVNQETGERLNIVFGEDSWLTNYNGADMIWNPVEESVVDDPAGGATYIFGGKHYIYVLNSRYDEGRKFKEEVQNPGTRNVGYRKIMWVGNPLLAKDQEYLPLSQGLIPTETRVRIRVERPYANYKPEGVTLRERTDPTQVGNPLYFFSTNDLAPKNIHDNPNLDKQALLDRINVVPNPYYGYAGYEKNRLDTRVRIINLPQKATVNIYSLEGALIRRLEKDNANAAYIDWDLRNSKGLPIASGMYLMHVQAEGIGETILKWFGAMRPVDVTSY